ncbi:PAS domain S-box protein [Candidatus Chlorohelix sp.]|uniref:PAS domain S-box protein n=1 Tax=Candidatus Chlorohelix sp. TaxID=3139201 RepID=UPI00305F3F2B
MSNMHQPFDQESPLQHSSPTNGMILPTLLDNLQTAVIALDSGWQFRYLNQSVANLLICNAAELMGGNFWSTFPAFGNTQFEQHFRRAMEEQTSAHFVEYYPPLQSYLDVQIYPAEGSLLVFLQKDASKEIDIPKSPQPTGLLQESEQIYHTFFENSMDGLMLTAPDGGILDANPAACRILGFSREELIAGGRGGIVDTSDPRLSEYLEQRILKGFAVGVLTFIRKDGVKIEVGLASRIFTNANGEARTSIIFRDITEHELLEASLRESEAKFSKIFQSSPVAAFISTIAEGRILDVNTTTLGLFGYTRTEMVGHTSVELDIWVTPESRQYIAERLRKDGHLNGFEVSFKRRDGEVIHTLASYELLELNGKTLVLSQLQDITERLRSAQSLERSNLRTVNILESISDAFYALDSEERFTYVNSKTEQLWQKRREDLLGKRIWDIFPQMVGLAPYQHLRQVLTEQIPVKFETFSVLLQQWVEVSVYPAAGGVSVYFRDVTERKLAERALQESEAKFSKIFQSSPIATILSTIAEGLILDVNNNTAELFGYSKEEIIGRTSAELGMWADYEARKQLQELLLKEGSVHALETSLKRRDGQIIQTLISIDLVELGGETVMLSMLQDITALKKAIQTQAQLAAIVEYSEDAIISKTLEGVILSWNEGATRMYGYTAEEIIGRSINLLVLPNRKDEMPPLLDTIRRGEHINRYETLRLCKDGTEIEVSLSISPLKDAAGNIIGASAISHDITERKQAEEALHRSEARFQAFMDNSPMLAWIADVEGEFRYVNKSFARMTGHEKERVIGKTVLELFPEEMAEQYRLDNLKVFETDKPFETQELYIRGDGSTGYALTTKFPLRDSSNPPLIGGVVIDITERVQADEALADEKERLSVTLRSIGDGVITTDLKGNITLINRVAEELTGWSHTDAIGLPLDTVFSLLNEETRQHRESPVRETLNSGRIIMLENHTLLVARDGVERVIMDSCAPIRDQKSNIIGAVLVFRDVTAQLKLEQEAQKSAKLESLGVFAGGLAHDFNNLLAGITGYLDLSKYYLENSELPHSTELEDFINQAQAATLRARGLTVQLLTFAKGGRPVKTTIALPPIIEEATRFMLHGTSVKPVFELPEDLYTVDADAGQLGQVVHNLVLNAVQAMPHGGILTISAKNLQLAEGTLPGVTAGRYVQVILRDEGGGISSENLSKIFDPYFTTKKSGNGLGLSVCHSIIRQHSGHMEVESVVGKGTTFTIYLPVSNQQSELSINQVASVSSYAPTTTTAYMRILVMDDEHLLRTLVKQYLQRLGHKVEVAEEGEEACQLYRAALETKHPFDVVLLDLTIPGGLGGKQTMVKLLELDPQVQAVVCSGYSNDPIMSDYQQYGFKAVLPKPYHMSDLQKLLVKLAMEKSRDDSDNAN